MSVIEAVQDDWHIFPFRDRLCESRTNWMIERIFRESQPWFNCMKQRQSRFAKRYEGLIDRNPLPDVFIVYT